MLDELADFGKTPAMFVFLGMLMLVSMFMLVFVRV